MRSSAGMANRRGAETCAKRKSPTPFNTLAWLGLTWRAGGNVRTSDSLRHTLTRNLTILLV